MLISRFSFRSTDRAHLQGSCLEQEIKFSWSGVTSRWQHPPPLSCPVLSGSLRPHARPRQARLPCPSRCLEFAQTHVCCVDDTTQLSYPLLLPSPLVLNLSQHQGLFQWVGSLHQVAKVLQLQLQSFQWIFRVDWFPFSFSSVTQSCPTPWTADSSLTGLFSMLSQRLSRVFSSTTLQKHQFFSAQSSLWSNIHICTWLLEKL